MNVNEKKAIEFLKSKGVERAKGWSLSHDELSDKENTVFFTKKDFNSILIKVEGFIDTNYDCEFYDEDDIDTLLERYEYEGSLEF